jgi:glycine C-acetyltransferase
MADLLSFLAENLNTLKNDGLYKSERVITSPQTVEITLENGQSVINMCANNYLGLADDPRLIAEAQKTLLSHGFGMASVRFICGTQNLHKTLENRVSAFLGTDDTILYSSCFDANAGLFETILGEEDAVISDALNHASIIDGIRLCKAKRYRYHNNDMADLEAKLQDASDQKARFILVVTDGVFSMDGTIANLPKIHALCQKYHALLMVDESHALGFMGDTGRGTPELFGLHGKIDLITGTFGKALGGASGGFTSGKKEIIAWLRQRSRPYLYSNTLMPALCASACKAFDLIDQEPARLQTLKDNTAYFRANMAKAGFDLIAGEHPIVPVMIYDAAKAKLYADLLLKEGVYAIAFSYPVVPHGKARIRTQISSSHTRQHLDHAIAAFTKIGKEVGVI